MNIEYTVQIWREGGHYIAHAMPLDVASSGATPQAARAALDEAVKLFIQTAGEHGTLREVLEDAGYENDGARWNSPDWVCFEKHSAPVAA
jgi:predicted RNase H-like HicB family nuclease